MKKSSSLWKQTDKLCGEVTRLRDRGKCRLCGSLGTDSHHIVPRSYTSTTFLPANRLWLCRTCHNHDDIELQTKCIQEIGEKEYQRLWLIARFVTQFRHADLISIRDTLKRAVSTFGENEHFKGYL